MKKDNSSKVTGLKVYKHQLELHSGRCQYFIIHLPANSEIPDWVNEQ